MMYTGNANITMTILPKASEKGEMANKHWFNKHHLLTHERINNEELNQRDRMQVLKKLLGGLKPVWFARNLSLNYELCSQVIGKRILIYFYTVQYNQTVKPKGLF